MAWCCSPAYVIVYALFVYLSAFRADLMAWQPMGGVNLAVWYGLGLIVFAIVLAVIYMLLCGRGGIERPRITRGATHEQPRLLPPRLSCSCCSSAWC
jgi:hypothetical protein